MNRPDLNLLRALGILLPVLLLGGCRGEVEQSDPSLTLSVAVSPTPPAVGPARLIVSLADTAGRPVDGARITVEGNMSHAGMVPVLDTARARGDGTYSVPEFRFTMAGDWILTVEATLPDGRTTATRMPVTVVGDMGGGS